MSPSNECPHALSQRQIEVLALVKKGLRNKEIAHHCGISERTVKWYIKQLLTVFNASNRTELAGSEWKIISKG